MDLSRRRFFGSRTSVAPFRPPWSMPEAVFVDACTRCDDCVTACPTGLLKRGDGGYPVADFSRAACTFCGECSDACSTTAIARDLAAAPWSFSIQIADGCLAHQRVECRVCGELCETDVIRFRPALGGVSRPQVDHAACTGCGACLAPCPVGAITRIARVAPPTLLSAELS